MARTTKFQIPEGDTVFGLKLSLNVQAVLLLVLTFAAYCRMLNNGFTYFSDDDYVLNNTIIQNLNLHNIRFMFSSYFDGHYHPLTMLSLGITYAMGGTNAVWYQATNLLFHLVNTLLVFWFVRALFKNQEMAFVVAMLFGLHTLHVESVARITERKDMLYTCFYLLSAIAYVKYAEQKRIKLYVYSVVLFVLSLLSKGQAVSLFITVVLIDYWLGRNLKDNQVLLEKLPFLLLALVFGYLNLEAQKYTGYLLDYKSMAFYEPFLDSAYVLTHYLGRMALPVGLSALYPYPNIIGQAVPAYMWLYLLVFVVLIAAAVYFYRKNKMAFFGLLFYVANVFMMLRIIPVAENIMPDRYNYVPSIGFFILIYSGNNWLKKYKPSYSAMAGYGLGAYLVLLLILTFLRCPIWRSGETVWLDAYEKYPDNTYVLQNVGYIHIKQHKVSQGLADLNRALQNDPQNLLALIARLDALKQMKDSVAAQHDLDYVRHLKPRSSEVYENQANILFLYGDLKKDGVQIEASYKKAIELYPYNAKYYYNLGVFQYKTERFDAALQNISHGLSFKPFNIEFYYLYAGMTEFAQNNFTTARSDFRTGLRYDPKNSTLTTWLQNTVFCIKNYHPETFYNTPKQNNEAGSAFFNHQAYGIAIGYFEKAIRLDSTDATGYQNRAIAYYSKGDYEQALHDLMKVKSLNADYDTKLMDELLQKCKK